MTARSAGCRAPRPNARSTLYSSFVAGDLFITSAESAELVKLTENAFRDVNIAFANELAAVCQDLSLNVWEVIDLANRHPRVNILQPGPGVGGHCIAVDPYFIIDAAPEQHPADAARRARSIRLARIRSCAISRRCSTRTAPDGGLPRPQLQTQYRRPARKPGRRGGAAPGRSARHRGGRGRAACRALPHELRNSASYSPMRSPPSTGPISWCCWSITASSA